METSPQFSRSSGERLVMVCVGWWKVDLNEVVARLVKEMAVQVVRPSSIIPNGQKLSELKAH